MAVTGKYEADVAAYEAEPLRKSAVMLYGSSFFANWKDASAQLREASGGALDVINRGFGGSTARDLLMYYPRLVRPAVPRRIIFRSGINDINGGESPEESMRLLTRVIDWARDDGFCAGADPGFVILGIFEHPSAAPDKRPLFARYDALAREYAEEHSDTRFLSVSTFFYEDESSVGTYEGFRDVFVPDGLHLTAEGYARFARYFAPILMSFDE